MQRSGINGIPREKRPAWKAGSLAILAILVSAAMVFATGAAAHTLQLADEEGFRPPLSINIPTVSFSRVAVQSTNSESGISGYIDVPWIAQYMRGLYTYAISVAGILAGVMFVIGGFYYLTAGGDASRVQKGRQRIADAIVGLFLAFGAYAILFTINPNMTIYEPLRIKTLKRVSFNDLTFNNTPMQDAPPSEAGTAATGAAPPPSGGGGGSTPRPPGPAAPRGASVPAAACSRSFVHIRDIPGVDGSRFTGNYQIHTDLSANLVSLSQGLAQINERINVGGTTRTQESQFLRHVQIVSACASIYAGVPAPSNACNSSGHAAGRAIDLNIGGRQLCTTHGVNIPRFMYDHGWARLCVERWHYEPLEDHRSGLHGSVNGTQCFGSGTDDMNSVHESGC
ncbi:MAG TPA: pilin [Candidatus Eisenbacteria bacterium]|nr:pilin [Candidatus Eisenbacteria bacterium]